MCLSRPGKEERVRDASLTEGMMAASGTPRSGPSQGNLETLSSKGHRGLYIVQLSVECYFLPATFTCNSAIAHPSFA